MDNLKEKLEHPLPEEAITQHPTKTYLSSIKAIYVTERFNEVFGVGKWQTKVEHITNGDKGMVVVKVTFTVPELNIYYECFGGNDNGGETSKNFDLGDAYKGATTDALTKIGSYLGVGIDVFKGKQQTQIKQNKPNKNWLNKGTEQWDKAIAYIQKGGSIADIQKKYAISKDNLIELQSI